MIIDEESFTSLVYAQKLMIQMDFIYFFTVMDLSYHDHSSLVLLPLRGNTVL